MFSSTFKIIRKDYIDKYLTLCKWLWIAAVLLFSILFINKNWDIVGEFFKDLPFMNLFMAFAALFIAKIFLTVNMYLTLEYEDIQLSFKDTFRIYNESQIAKYIPGSIWHFVGKATFLRQRKLTFTQIKNVMFLELIWVVGSSLIFGCIFLYLSSSVGILYAVIHDRIYPSLKVLVPMMIILIIILTFKHGSMSRMRYWIYKYKLHLFLTVNSFLIWIFIGYSFYALFMHHNVKSTSFTFISGLYAIAYLIGFIFPLAPAGIGLRESILVFGLSGILEHNTAIVMCGVNRLVYILTEIIFLFICFAIGNLEDISCKNK